VLNLLIVLWGKTKPTRALALQMVKFYLKGNNVTYEDIAVEVQKKLCDFVCRGLDDRDAVISRQAKSLFLFLEKRIPSLAKAVRSKSKSHLLPRSTSTNHRAASFRSISRDILPRTPELKITADVDEVEAPIVKSPAELELDFHRELNCIEERMANINKIQKMLSESPQPPSETSTPLKVDLDDLAAKLRRANKREAIRKRLQKVEVETNASECGGKMLNVRKSTIVADSDGTPSVDEDISMSGDENGLGQLVQELQQANEAQKIQEEECASTTDFEVAPTSSSRCKTLSSFTFLIFLTIFLFGLNPSPTTVQSETIQYPMCDIITPSRQQHYYREFHNLINSHTIFQKSESHRALQRFQREHSSDQYTSPTIPHPEPLKDKEKAVFLTENLSFWAKSLIKIQRFFY